MKTRSLFVVLTGIWAAVCAQGQPFHHWPGPSWTPEPYIVFPRNNAQLTTNEITVSGFAAGWGGITSVQYLVNGSGPYTATQPNSNYWVEWQAPVTLNAGSNLFQVWAVGTNGSSPTNSANYFLVATSPITINIVGPGMVEPNLNGQNLVLGRTYAMVAVPDKGQLFAGWSGTVTSSQAFLHFVMQSNEDLTATFVSSPFSNGLAGAYSGLFYDPTNMSDHSSGFLTLKLAGDGDFDGYISLDGGTRSFESQFDTNGSAQLTLSRPGQSTLSLSLSLDLSGLKGLTGTVSGGGTNTNGFTSSLQAYKQIHQASNYDGYYTWAMSGSAAGPDGDSYGTAWVLPDGDAVVFLSLSDGSFAFASGELTDGGLLPLYVPLYGGYGSSGGPGWHGARGSYGGHGSLSGWLTFTNGGLTTNSMDWFKDPGAYGAYSNGFALTGLPLWLDPYMGTNGFGSSNVVVQLSGGDLTGSLTDFVTLDTSAVLSATNTNDVALWLNVSTGLFYGSFIDPTNGGTNQIRGALLQSLPEGLGFFTASNHLSGAVSVTP